LKELLLKINHLIDCQEKISARTGDDFNIFKILGVEALEVRTHSAFLRELLDKNGSHGMGPIFLKLLLNRLRILDFDAESSSVEAEKGIGRINETYTCGGRIDLVVWDKDNRHIFIENKIYAGDQENQLFRYYQHNPKATLIYLTLNGDDPSEFSKGDNPNIPYIKMAYANEILLWLKDCRKEAVTHPVVREALTQYIELICHLTNQTTKDSMKEEIEQMLKKQPEYIKAISDAWSTWNYMREKAKMEFLRILNERLSTDALKLTDNLSIKFVAGDDYDGVFIGYKLFDGDKNIYTSKIAERYFNEMQTKNRGTTFYRKGNQWLCWYNPEPFAPKIRFVNLDPKKILELYSNPDEMKKFVQCIVEQDQKIRTAFADWQKQDSLKE
jgi:hypothetical protein